MIFTQNLRKFFPQNLWQICPNTKVSARESKKKQFRCFEVLPWFCKNKFCFGKNSSLNFLLREQFAPVVQKKTYLSFMTRREIRKKKKKKKDNYFCLLNMFFFISYKYKSF